MTKLTHFSAAGDAHMVDVGEKPPTKRVAIAMGTIFVSAAAFAAVAQGNNKKGDVLAIARIAAIQASKKTAELIPLCHPLYLTHVSVDFTQDAVKNTITITVKTETEGKTGVEMEALTAASVGLLTIYDMLKAVDKSMIIEGICLVEKQGGKSGPYIRP